MMEIEQLYGEAADIDVLFSDARITMKKEINVFEYADKIMQGLQKGALLTTKNGEKVNTMTISWGTLGIEWGKPIFITFVRENRLTRELLDTHPEFTVSVPTDRSDKKIGGFCGMNSGRDVDKIAAMDLTLVPSDTVEVPGIGEYPIILECKLLYRQKQDPEEIPELENEPAFYRRERIINLQKAEKAEKPAPKAKAVKEKAPAAKANTKTKTVAVKRRATGK